MSDPFIGELKLFPYNFAPRGWAFCNGQILSIAQNTALFSLLGTTYGGNGQTTFALPDLRGRVPISSGQGPGLSNYSLGQQAGSETVTLLSNNLPAHTHTVQASTEDASSSQPGGKIPAAVGAGAYGGPAADTTMAANMIGITGNNQPVPIVPPYLTLNWCIALEGIFPSRN
jgi:microcystin-dependent protein